MRQSLKQQRCGSMLLFSIANFSSGIGLSQEGAGAKRLFLRRGCLPHGPNRPSKELQLFFRMGICDM